MPTTEEMRAETRQHLRRLVGADAWADMLRGVEIMLDEVEAEAGVETGKYTVLTEYRQKISRLIVELETL